jgi:hypothetical protein
MNMDLSSSNVADGRIDPTFAAVATQQLTPLFWPCSRVGVGSAWYEHVPFGHWIVFATRPRTLVELGTHAGVSYFAFCEAVSRLRLDTRCLAVDTWLGDSHSGFYGEEVFTELQKAVYPRYGAFSQLLRTTFDDALRYVHDGSVDLLHIDGRHKYGDVRHDFLTWKPKLSPRAVVLFHDTNVHERDFGVWKLWAELKEGFPSFEFLHGYGLGVLAAGKEVPLPIAQLCGLRDPDTVAAVRERFALLGKVTRLEEQETRQQRAIENQQRTIEAQHRAIEEQQQAVEAQQRAVERQLGIIDEQRLALNERERIGAEQERRIAGLLSTERELRAALMECQRALTELDRGRSKNRSRSGQVYKESRIGLRAVFGRLRWLERAAPRLFGHRHRQSKG